MSNIHMCLSKASRLVTPEQMREHADGQRQMLRELQTMTWRPIAHADVLDKVKQGIDRAGLVITDQKHALWGDKGERYFGIMEVRGNAGQRDDFGQIIGLRNSIDKSLSARIGAGSRVFICDNLDFAAELQLARKHTRWVMEGIDLNIDRIMAQCQSVWNHHEERITAYRECRLNRGQVHDLTVRAIQADVLPQSKLLKVLDEYQEPKHFEFKQNGETLWRLYNAFTETLKEVNPWTLTERTTTLQKGFDARTELATAA